MDGPQSREGNAQDRRSSAEAFAINSALVSELAFAMGPSFARRGGQSRRQLGRNGRVHAQNTGLIRVLLSELLSEAVEVRNRLFEC